VSTPPYLPPSIGPSGLIVSTYLSILQDNLAGFLNIFGQNQYVGPDSAVYQLLAILSLKQADQNAALQLAYNQSSPQTAVGTGLDRAVKMNGLARAPLTYSMAVLTVVGTAGTVIINGFAQDQNGNLWALPAPTTITGGSVNVTATCTTPGNISAEPGTINIISTPQSGWTAPSGTVTNASAAIPGDSVEADSELRARQSISVALPALTPIAATIAAVLATLGVTRVAPGYQTLGGPGTSIENPTAATDSWGNPAHSITMVVEGGTNAAVALSILLKKTIGCFTNGTTSVVVADPVTGYDNTISFYRPSYVQPFVGVYVHGLTGFTTAMLTAIQAAVVTYLDSLAIGEGVVYSSVYGAVLSVIPNASQPAFSIKGLTLGTTATGLFNVVPGASAGSGYVVNDVLTVAGGTGGTVTVTSVGGSGAVTGIAPQVTTPGSGYAVTSAVATTGGTGTGAHVNITAVQPVATTDLTLLFYDAAQGETANVVVAAV
jgi:uncharacterized phage protein gp47/JayE